MLPLMLPLVADWAWSGCKPLYSGLVAVRNDTGAGLELGEGFETARGFYRILLERRLAGWGNGLRKATCERASGAEAQVRILMLNKYVFIPGAVVPNASRDQHWGWSLNLWAQHNTTSHWLLHTHAAIG